MTVEQISHVICYCRPKRVAAAETVSAVFSCTLTKGRRSATGR